MAVSAKLNVWVFVIVMVLFRGVSDKFPSTIPDHYLIRPHVSGVFK